MHVATINKGEKYAPVEDEALCYACNRQTIECGPMILCLIEAKGESRLGWLCAEDVVWLNPVDRCMTATPVRLLESGGYVKDA